eukprot:TRINITY_DN38200_c0_g1_i1.p2 TRINITY_DN38200_c0_g1~~TRINITY_DN38200_c0_g1_i1.p2  ORF type:complete len:140 (-),score=57.39 TRINITY_DN38200_c0_g1_i1:15-434(-)
MIRHLLGRTQLRAASQPHILALTRLSQQAAAGSHKFEATDGMRRKLIYRAKQRGWLEMDLILGDWAATNLVDMEEFQLRQFEEILDMENPDLFKWLTGQEAVPELSLIHISEPTRLLSISYAVFCLKKKKNASPLSQVY